MNAINTSHSPSQPMQPQPGPRPVPAPALPLEVWGATDKGRAREGNEDAIYPHSGSETFPFKPGPAHLAQKGQLLIVADGVGGAQGGREASHWAIRVAVERYYDLPGPDLGADLRAVIETANGSLYQYLQSTGTREAGSTMAAAVIHGSTLYMANVGDSRIYLIRNGQINQLTRDHTLTQRKIDQGLIRPEQAEMDSDRNVLTRSMGAGPSVQVDLFPTTQLAPGDVVLLCSDGLTDMLEDAEIARLAGSNSPKRAAQRLIAAANKRGGFDNISVIVARTGGRTAPARGGLLDNIRKMTRQQKIILLAGAVLAPIVLCAGLALSWAFYNQPRATPTPTPAPTATVEASPTEATALTAPAAAPSTSPDQPTDTVPAGAPTSTPMPTHTPTPTQRPPAPTHTPMPTMTPMPTLSPTPMSDDLMPDDDDDDNGNGEEPPPTR